MRFGIRGALAISAAGSGGGGAAANVPAITSITSDNGDSSTDGITSDQTLTINGTSDASAIVEVFKDAVSIGTVAANGSGVWAFNHTGTTLSAGTYAFTAKATSASAQSAASSAFTVVVDVTAPTAAITYSVAGPYKQGASVTITATFSEAMASNVTPKIAITGNSAVAATNMTRVSSTVYTYALTVGTGTGTATVALSIGTDIAGNVVTAAPSSGSTFTVDNTLPTVTITSDKGASGSSISTSPITFTFTFSESVTLFVVGDITVTGTGNGAKSGFSGSGTTYTCVVTPANDGTVIVDVASGVCIDAAGNTNSAATQFTHTYSSDVFASIAAGAIAAQTSANRITDKGVNPDPAVSDGSGGTAASPLTSGQWASVKNSGSQVSLLTAYNGGAHDPVRKRIYVCSAGHSDGYHANGAYYDYSTGLAGTWGLGWWPSSNIDATGTLDAYADGSMVSRHTYSSGVIVGDYYYVSGAAVGVAASGPTRIWRRKVDGSDSWSQITTTGYVGGDYTNFLGMAYDPTSGLVWCINLTALYTFDPTNWAAGVTRRFYNNSTNYWNWNSDQMSMAIDVAKRKILIIGGSLGTTIDITDNTITSGDIKDVANGGTLAFTGNGAADVMAGAARRLGICYDSVNEDIVMWNGGATFYIVDLTASTIVKEIASSGATPPAMTANGILNRLAAHNGIITIVNDNAVVHHYRRP